MQIGSTVRSVLGRVSVQRAALAVSCVALIAGFSACGAAGGDEEEGQLATSREPVQLAWVGWNESTTTTGVNLLKASSQSVIGKATGAMRYSDPHNNGVKFNCGVTFISHHYALTAAHCVPSSDLTLNNVFTVEQYNTTNLDLNQAFGTQAQISGAWPNYTRTRKLTSADGYIVKPYTCKVVRRCSDIYGRDNCQLPATNSLDLAMISCSQRETNVVNYVKVATNTHANEVKAKTRNVEVWWFHEVVNLATSANMPYEPYMPNFNWEHYGKFQDDHTLNYHYWHSAADTDRQLLPLVSKHTSTNAPYQVLATESQYILDTNIPVCHGTSGSGVFASGTNEFMGIVAEFGNSFNGVPLCVPITDSSAGNGMGFTQHNWAQTFESLPEVLGDR